MKRSLLAAWLILSCSSLFSQTRIFSGELSNDEYHVFIKLNLYDKNILVPGQSVYGKLSGYLGNTKSNYIWLITSSQVIDNTNATIGLINDFGSEDLTCTLTFNADSTYTLKQKDGSALKIVEDRKYVKLPQTINLKRKK
jgi:hypothetical protein